MHRTPEKRPTFEELHTRLSAWLDELLPPEKQRVQPDQQQLQQQQQQHQRPHTPGESRLSTPSTATPPPGSK